MFKCNNCDKTYKSHSRFLKHKYICVEKQEKNSGIKKIPKIIVKESNEEEPYMNSNSRMRKSTRSDIDYTSDRSRRSTRSDIDYTSDRPRRKSTRTDIDYDSDNSMRMRNSFDSSHRHKLIGRDTDIVEIRDLVDRLRRDKKRYKQEILDLKGDTRKLEYTENKLRNELLLISSEKQELNEKLSNLIKENEEVISKYSDGENTLTQLNQQRTYLINYTKELTDKLNQHDQKSEEILKKQTENSEEIIEMKDKRIHELASVIMKNVNKHTNDMEKLKTDLEKIHEKEKSEIEAKFSNVIRNLTSNNLLMKNQIISNKEEYEKQLNTLRTDYEKKLKDTSEQLKSSWSSDVIEQRKELNKTITKQKSDIEKIKQQYENSNDIKVLKDEIEGYKKQIVQLKQNVTHMKTTVTNTSSNFKEYKDNTDNIISKLNEDVKKIQTKREKDAIYNSRRIKTISNDYENQLTEHKLKITDLEYTITSLHNYKIELDEIRTNEQKLKEELNLTKMIIINEREKFNKEYHQLIDKNKKDMDDMNKLITEKDMEIDTYKKKLLVYHNENNTDKKKLEQQITIMKKEHQELLHTVQSTEKINDLMKNELKREKENFNKQLSILERYKEDNDNGISYIKEKLSETEKELEKFKTMSKDLHQRLLVRSDDFKRAKNRVIDLENLLENTVKKFTTN